MYKLRLMCRWWLLPMLAVAVPAAGQSLENRLRDQLRATTAQLNDAQTALASANAAKAAAEAERDAAKAKAAAPAADPRALAAARAETAAAAARAQSAGAGLAQANAEAAALRSRLAAAQAELAQARQAASTSGAATGQLTALIGACAANNAELVATGREVLAAYTARFGNGYFPPLQLARVRFENAAQVYGDRIAANRFVAPNMVTQPTPRETETKRQ